jgi:hypothetical protein
MKLQALLRQTSKIPKSLRGAGFAAGVAAFSLLACAPALLPAQQAYPASPSSSPYAGGPYSNSYPQQPNSQYGDGQQPYAQPQYAQPQAPQYSQQPQYGDAQPSPQPYSAPDQQYQQPDAYSQPDLAQPPAQTQAPLNAQDLAQLVAPIALYPDALLAQILTASTYPAQVAVADQWLQQMRAQGYSSPDQIAAGANQQADWDPSVKALTAYPDVLDMLNHNLEWTSSLGNAYYNQPQDVMQTVQVLRERAQQAGNLQSTPQEQVNDEQGYIQLAPANPQVVYVPTYNPWAVYGAPIAPYPGFSFVGALGAFFGALPIRYGLGFALGAFQPFGWMAWGLDWLAHAVLFDHNHYFTYSASVHDWGLTRGGPRAYNGWRQNARAPGGYGGGYRTAGATQGFGRGYNSRAQAGPPANSYRAPATGPMRQTEPYRQAPSNGYNRGYQQPAYGGTHPALPGQGPSQNFTRTAPQTYAYRAQTYPNRPQSYSSPSTFSRPQGTNTPGYGSSNAGSSYGYGSQNRQTQAFASRPGYAAPYGSYRAPQPAPSRSYDSRSYQSYGNFARNEPSGGFRGFSGEKEPRGFGSEKEPKSSYKASRSFGGGEHFKAPKAPKASHGGGGGHHRF